MPASRVGLFDSLRGLFATAFELAQVRLELLINDLEFEKQRLAGVALLGLVGLLLIGTGLLLFIGLVLLLFWDQHRLPALAVLMLLCVGSGTALMFAARRRLRAPRCAAGATSPRPAAPRRRRARRRARRPRTSRRTGCPATASARVRASAGRRRR
jgi:uncharacterized membrane protein YqjE